MLYEYEYEYEYEYIRVTETTCCVEHGANNKQLVSRWYRRTLLWCCSLVTRHSLVRVKGEVFVLLYVFCLFFCSVNDFSTTRGPIHAKVCVQAYSGSGCLLPFWGLAAPGGRKMGQMKFSLLWESMGNFCILAVFERYLSNACTDPHQILFV